MESNVSFKLKRWNFNTSLKFSYLLQNLENSITNTEEEKYSLLFTPKIRISYSINKYASLRLTGSYNEKLQNEGDFYNNIIFTSNRSAIRNNASLETLKNYIVDLGFYHNDFFNLSQYYFGLNYMKNQNSYISKLEINDLFTSNTRELSDAGFDNFSLYGGMDKYVRFIKSNVRLNVSYGINSYKNSINSSEVRDNLTHSSLSSLNVKTGFLGIINFENYFQLTNASFQNSESDWVSNSSIYNSFKTYLKPAKRIKLTTDFRYYLPNTDSKEDFLYLDSSLTFTSKNGTVDYSIISKNISAKENIFTKTDVSDYYRSTTIYNLLSPYIIFSVRFKM